MWNTFYRRPRLLGLTILMIGGAGLAAYSLLPRATHAGLLKDIEVFNSRFREHASEISHLDLDPLAAIASLLGGDFAGAEDITADFRAWLQSSQASSLALGTLSFIESLYLTMTADHDASLGAVARGLEVMRSHA